MNVTQPKTEQQFKAARENYNLHLAEMEVASIPPHINRAGQYYRYLIKDINRRYGITL